MHTLRSFVGIMAILVITLCVALLGNRLLGQARVADLTDAKVYTLSEGTTNILKKLNQPVTLKLYYSRTVARNLGHEEVRDFNNYFLMIRDLLEEYASRSEGKVQVEVLDPEPYGEEEEEAIALGVRPVQIPNSSPFYLGLVASTELGKQEVIPFMRPERKPFIEYDITKLVADLIQRDRQTIGILSSLPVLPEDLSPYMMQMMQMQGRPMPQPWLMVQSLRSRYEVVQAQVTKGAFQEELDYLMVIHPKEFDAETLYAIDQYVMKGGRALVFVDPHCLLDQPQQANPYMPPTGGSNSDLNALLATWGVRTRSESGQPMEVAVDRDLAESVPLARGQPPTLFLPFLTLAGEACFNQEQPMVANLDQLHYVIGGVVNRIDGTGTRYYPLLTTTQSGNIWIPKGPMDLANISPRVAQEILRDVGSPLESVTLGGMLAGPFKTNFPQGIEVEVEAKEMEPADAEGPGSEPVAAQPSEDAATGAGTSADDGATTDGAEDADGAETAEAPPTITVDEPPAAPVEDDDDDGEAETPKVKVQLTPVLASKEDARVVVIADVDMITDQFAYRNHPLLGVTKNGDANDLLFNLLESLGGDEDLLKVRSRGRIQRELTVFKTKIAAAEKKLTSAIEEENKKIERLGKELRELGAGPDGQDPDTLQSKAAEKVRKLQAEMRQANIRMRRIRQRRNKEIDAMRDAWWRTYTFWPPALTISLAILVGILRLAHSGRYQERG